eukprot:1987726-Pyramimonas_sp.AAC.1
MSLYTGEAGSRTPRAVARRPAPPRAARSGRSRPCDPGQGPRGWPRLGWGLSPPRVSAQASQQATAHWP